MRKVCVITGTRAEYGLLRWVIDGIEKSSKLDLQIIATGMHLAPEFGLTYLEIEKDGYFINSKVELLVSSDTKVGIAKSIGLGLIGFADALDKLNPDMVLVLGDRYEIFAGVVASMVARIPVIHISGGEATEGLIDEPIRHSITKMSHLHFVANEEYRDRVIQLGEQPDRVFNVGGVGVDNILKMELLNKEDLELALDFSFGPKNLLVTFHPVTLEEKTSESQMKELLEALSELSDTHIIITMPNADTDGRILFKLIDDFVSKYPNAKSFVSLGQLRYLSTVAHVDAVVGNSSSGIAEVPSFKKGTINIGDRQKGRIKAESIIDCDPIKSSILDAIEKIYTPKFKGILTDVTNPYGIGGASEAIVNQLEIVDINNIIKKSFYDLSI